jgi:two-component system response regulator YesN
MTKRRVLYTKQLLAEQSLSITDIAERLGFRSVHNFSSWFRRETGLYPSDYRANPDLL